MHDFYLNKFFQNLFFGNSGTAKILLMVLVFLLDLGLVMGVDGFLIHNIPAVSHEESAAFGSLHEGPDFSQYIDGEILDVYGNLNGYHVLYQSDSGETKLVEVKANDIFYRYRIDRGSELVIPADRDIYHYDNGSNLAPLTFTITNGSEITELTHWDFQLFSFGGNETLIFYMSIAAVMLLVETYILNKITGKE